MVVLRGYYFWFNFFIGIVFLLTFTACEKDNTNPIGEENPTDQIVEFNLFYGGTARTQSGREHPLRLKVSHDGSEYLTLTKKVSPGKLREGWVIKTPQKLEPGIYKLGGYWDWNESGFQNSNEQIISEASFEVKGFEVKTFNFDIIDKTNPSDLGWFKGNVKYVGSVSGEHHLRMLVQDFDGNVVSDERCFNSLKNLFKSTTEFVSAHIPEGEYKVITLYWDVNDNGTIQFSDPHCLLMGDHYISPGLGTLQGELTMDDSN